MVKSGGEQQPQGVEKLPGEEGWAGIVTGALVLLPTLSYVSFAAMVGITGAIALRWPRQWWAFLTRQGYTWIGLGLILSTLLAYDPAAAWLQLANFLPFMAMMAAIALWLRHSPQPFRYLEIWATLLLWITIPLNGLAFLEYLVMTPQFIPHLETLPVFREFYAITVSFGHRAALLYGSPNTLACYFGFVLALGLGLLLKRMVAPTPSPPPLGGVGWDWVEGLYRCSWLWPLATLINLLGIFCTGSRNGLLTTGAVVLVALGQFPRQCRFRRTCWLGWGLVGLAVAKLGLGERGITQVMSPKDPRWQVWGIAWNHAVNHPWFGIGLGNYGVLYEPGSVMGFEEMPHAHNLWLMLAAEAGFPVAIGLTLVVGIALYRVVRTLAWRSPGDRALVLAYIWAFGVLVVFSGLDLAIAYPRITFLGWWALGILYGVTPPAPQPQVMAHPPEQSPDIDPRDTPKPEWPEPPPPQPF